MSSNTQRRGSSSSSSSSSSGKQRRKSRPRSNQLNINVAEARRQVYQALILHRTSPKASFSSSSSSSSSSLSTEVVNGTSTQLLQSMPQPEPVWSTTAPSVLPPVPYSDVAAMETGDIEFEWEENQASSYAWWLAFLKSLGGNRSPTSTILQDFKYHPLALGVSNWFFGQRPLDGGNVKVEEADDDDDDDDDEQSPSPDEWLMIPTTTENHEDESNHVFP